MKLVKHIANLGYGSRKQVQWMFREGRITDADGEVLYADDQVPHEVIRVDGEPLTRRWACRSRCTSRLATPVRPRIPAA